MKATDDRLTTLPDLVLAEEKGEKKRKENQMGGRSECVRRGFLTVHMKSEVKGQCSATVGVRAIQRRRPPYGAETDLPPGEPCHTWGASQLSLTVTEQSLPIGQQLSCAVCKTQHTLL